MKAFLAALFSALFAALADWLARRRTTRAEVEAEALRSALASVGEARELEQDLAGAASRPRPASPRPGERRIEAATGRAQRWDGAEWRELEPEEGFFHDGEAD